MNELDHVNHQQGDIEENCSSCCIFQSLPYEMILHVMDFLVDRKLSDSSRIKEYVLQMAIFESLNSKLNSIEQVRKYLNGFWWKLFKLEYGMVCNEPEIRKLKEIMIRNNCLKRKILSIRYFAPQKKLLLPAQRKLFLGLVIRLSGKEGVGKKTLAKKYLDQYVYQLSYSPALVKMGRKIEFYGRKYQLTIRDEGYEEEEYTAFSVASDGAICICSANDKQFAEDLESWSLEWLKSNKDNNTFPITFAINKVDISNRIQIEERRAFIEVLIKKYNFTNAMIFEISSISGQNVVKAIEETAKQVFWFSIDKPPLIDFILNVVESEAVPLIEIEEIVQHSAEINPKPKTNCLIM